MNRDSNTVKRFADAVWVGAVVLLVASWLIPYLSRTLWSGPAEPANVATLRLLLVFAGMALTEDARVRRTLLVALAAFALMFGGSLIRATSWRNVANAPWVPILSWALAFTAGLLLGYSSRLRIAASEADNRRLPEGPDTAGP